MAALPKGTDINALKEELMQCLAAHDARALKVIARLKQEGARQKDMALLGYAYYRYAYYYYFVEPDSRKFHHHLQMAIRHLLRSDDLEYLAGSYNLVAYEAQDYGCFDIAYAYYMLALKAAEQVEGIPLPGLLEGNAGRLHMVLGNVKEGRRLFRSAIRRQRPYTTAHFYFYNMVVTYADEALASFLLRDKKGTSRVLFPAEALFQKAGKKEQELCRVYFILLFVYDALLAKDKKRMQKILATLFSALRATDANDLADLLPETEALFLYMIENGYERDAKRLLDATRRMADSEKLSGALRYISLHIRFHEQTGNERELHKSLRRQHEIQKRRREEQIHMQRYATELVEMVESIAGERAQALEEQAVLKKRVNTDALTKLPNRHDMNKQLRLLREAAQREKIPFGIGILDVDRFKEYNDTHGHREGDACLRTIGEVLGAVSSAGKLYCARYGGDEFVLCFTGVTRAEMKKAAAGIQKQIEEALEKKISVSIGICHADSSRPVCLWDYLSAADKALYRIKKKGGGSIGLTKPVTGKRKPS